MFSPTGPMMWVGHSGFEPLRWIGPAHKTGLRSTALMFLFAVLPRYCISRNRQMGSACDLLFTILARAISY